jgi:putative ABC transport system substrate-binding protein
LAPVSLKVLLAQAAMRPDFVNIEDSVAGKWLGLLKELAPHTSWVSVLFNPRTALQSTYYLKLLEATARSLALNLKTAQVSNADEIDAEIDRLAQQSNTGLLVLLDVFTAALPQRDLIVARTAQQRISGNLSSCILDQSRWPYLLRNRPF